MLENENHWCIERLVTYKERHKIYPRFTGKAIPGLQLCNDVYKYTIHGDRREHFGHVRTEKNSTCASQIITEQLNQGHS